jgi:hypothetical protein
MNDATETKSLINMADILLAYNFSQSQDSRPVCWLHLNLS